MTAPFTILLVRYVCGGQPGPAQYVPAACACCWKPASCVLLNIGVGAVASALAVLGLIWSFGIPVAGGTHVAGTPPPWQRRRTGAACEAALFLGGRMDFGLACWPVVSTIAFFFALSVSQFAVMMLRGKLIVVLFAVTSVTKRR